VSARDEVLGRIRTALRGSGGSAPEVARDYRQRDGRPPGHPELLDLLADRLVDYRAEVLRCDHDGIRDAVTRALVTGVGENWRREGVLAAPGVPGDWRPEGVADDPGEQAARLAERDAALIGVAWAVAETGTLMLDGGARCGRRALSLLPDCCVCVVEAEQVVGSVPEAFARLDASTPITMVSGPSATSDIELRRVEGVHGPRRLHVVLVV
jgi:L-lactate dehydrogenase complex protein LldG